MDELEKEQEGEKVDNFTISNLVFLKFLNCKILRIQEAYIFSENIIINYLDILFSFFVT